MDILRPKLLWIGKRCYRVNDVANDSEFEQQTTANNEYIEDGLCFFHVFFMTFFAQRVECISVVIKNSWF